MGHFKLGYALTPVKSSPEWGLDPKLLVYNDAGALLGWSNLTVINTQPVGGVAYEPVEFRANVAVTVSAYAYSVPIAPTTEDLKFEIMLKQTHSMAAGELIKFDNLKISAV